MLFGLSKTIGLRMPIEEEILGADYAEHGTVSANIESIIEDGFAKAGLKPSATEKFLRKVSLILSYAKMFAILVKNFSY